MRYYRDHDHMIESMKNTWQVVDRQSVYDHCLSVQSRAMELLDHLDGLEMQSKWVLPPWWEKYRSILKLHLCHREEIKRYTFYHDCGKPLVAERSGSKMVFKGHEYFSSAVYSSFLKRDRRVIRMIAQDMDLHRSRAEDIPDLISRKEIITLLFVAICEVHSNAELFGGFDSDSFRIKLKKIYSRGKAILEHKTLVSGNRLE